MVLAVGVWIAAGAGCAAGEALVLIDETSGSGGGAPGSGGGAPGSGAAGTGTVGTTGGGGATVLCTYVGGHVVSWRGGDVIILMDRSSSMADDINEMSCPGGCGPSSKWSIASAAVEAMVAQNPQINWGLVFYGGDDQCGFDWAVVEGTNTGPAITAALAAAAPGGDAPTSAGVTSVATHLKGLWAGDILLVSDGRSGCGASSTDGTGRQAAEQAVAAALNQSFVPTLVFGLAPSSDTAAVAHLNTLALNGGESVLVNGIAYNTPDNPPTFPAVLGPVCFVPAAPPAGVPMGGDGIVVSLTLSSGSSVTVPKDPNNGWSVNSDATAIIVSGDYCTQLGSGAATSVTVKLCQTR